MIPFNKPYLSGNEISYIKNAIEQGHISGNGMYTKKCQQFFEDHYRFRKCLLTTSCTDALEMAAILCDLQPGDEVIVPSYTFVSTANAFVLRGAKIVFVDSRPDHPGLDENLIEPLITKRTRVIVPVHYAGVACDMDKIMALANKYHLLVVEDAAQAIDSFYKGRPLGGIGHLAAFSFHETKNIISGEGGMLVINDERFMKRAEIIWEKGTNRTAFFKGEVDKYGWTDIGSSFLPSEIIAAFLWAQLESLDDIQRRRSEIWKNYCSALDPLGKSGKLKLPRIPDYAVNNAHSFYILLADSTVRDRLIEFLRKDEVHAVFHYLSLHLSPYYHSKHDGRALPNCEYYSDKLLRLPFYYELNLTDQQGVIDKIFSFFARSHQ
jgi:dTDP-4-amino-4,6-dideoxygalactose transaminase